MTHHKQPLEPDTDLAIKKLQEKGYDVAKKPKNGKKALAYWVGLVSAIFVAVPTAIAGSHWFIVWVSSPSILQKHEGQIATIEKEQQNQRDEQKIINAKLTDIVQSQQHNHDDITDIRTSLRRIEAQLSWQYGSPPTVKTNTDDP